MMTDQPAGTCSSCEKPKRQLKARKSKLMPNTTLLLCTTCFERKLEPRFAVIMGARDRKNEARFNTAAEFIRNKRYLGEPITARELV